MPSRIYPVILLGVLFALDGCEAGGGDDDDSGDDDVSDDDVSDDDVSDDDDTVAAEFAAPGSWEPRAPMPTPRNSFAAVARGDLVHVMGGTNISVSSSSALDTVEIYDVQADSWSSGVPLPAPALGPAAAVIDDKIYVAGGYSWDTESDYFLDRLDCFDPGQGSWAELAPLPSPRSLAAGAALDGVFYVIGGRDSAYDAMDSVIAFDPSLGTWSTRAPLPTAMEGAAATTVGDKIVVGGGFDADAYAYLDDVLIYDSTADSWSVVSGLASPRCALGAASLWDRYAIFAGGYFDGGDIHLDYADVFDSSTSQTESLAPLPDGRGGLGLVAVDGQRLFAIGGADYGGSLENAWDPMDDVWEWLPEPE
jgi:hypothetical protein